MLGATMLEHSAHFRKCPDLTWKVFFRKGIPCSVGVLIAVFVLVARRGYKLHASCHPLGYALFAAPFPYVFWGYTVIGGLFLVYQSQQTGRKVTDRDSGKDLEVFRE